MIKNPKLFCAGLGFTATELIKQLKNESAEWHFSGSHRTSDKRTGQTNIQTVEFDGNIAIKDPALLLNATHLLISTPPSADHAEPFISCHEELIPQMKNLQWVAYLSTTGVYGDQGGNWVGEEGPMPEYSTLTKRGQIRVRAEKFWQDLATKHNLPLHIFRLSSIYGEGRGAMASLIAGRTKKIVKEGQFFSRVHVEDIAQVLSASMKNINKGQVYNVADDLPYAPDQITDYLCHEMGIPELPSISVDDPSLSPMMTSFYSENKKIQNTRIKEELGITLKYPSFKEGYAPQILKYKKGRP